MIKQAIHQLSNKQDLTTEQAIVSMQEIMSGIASNIQIASFFDCFAIKGRNDRRNNSFCSSHERKSSKHRL